MEKKPKALQAALDKAAVLPDEWFGKEVASFDDLPSIASKKDIMRTSIYLKKQDLEFLKNISRETHVPVAQITGEIISSFIQQTRNRALKSKL